MIIALSLKLALLAFIFQDKLKSSLTTQTRIIKASSCKEKRTKTKCTNYKQYHVSSTSTSNLQDMEDTVDTNAQVSISIVTQQTPKNNKSKFFIFSKLFRKFYEKNVKNVPQKDFFKNNIFLRDTFDFLKTLHPKTIFGNNHTDLIAGQEYDNSIFLKQEGKKRITSDYTDMSSIYDLHTNFKSKRAKRIIFRYHNKRLSKDSGYKTNSEILIYKLSRLDKKINKKRPYAINLPSIKEHVAN